MPRSEQKRP